jgi:peptidoglycan hydrolase-like protein with peptidoglycan-binding domain
MATTNMSKPASSTTNMSKPSSTVTTSAPKTTTTSSVGKNISSLSTSAIQSAVGAKSDGIYGSQTTAAVKAFQTANGLVADGIVGPKTQAAIQSKSGTGTSTSSGGGSSSGGNSIINNQANLVQSTATTITKQNEAGVKIDNAVNAATGVYGTPVKDESGKVIGYEAYDTKTGKPLQKPEEKTPLPEGNVQDTLGNKYFSSMPKEMTYKLPPLSVEGNKWVFDEAGQPFEMDKTGKVVTNQLANEEWNKNRSDNAIIEQNNQFYEESKVGLDMEYQSLINNIVAKAERNRREQADLNERTLGAKRVAGFRTGATEYTPEIAMGIIKNEIEQGQQKIKDIDDQMRIDLVEAASAKRKGDLAIAKQKFDTYNTLKEKKEEAIVEIYKLHIDEQKVINDAKKAAITEARAKEDQGIQVLKTTAKEYLDGYNKSKDKNKYINDIALDLGVRPETVLSQIKGAIAKPKTSTSTTKPFFTPTAADKSTVAVYASKNPEIDKAKLETDLEYFAWVLGKAKESLKKPTGGGRNIVNN